MLSKIILIDLDGPLADFEGEFLKKWKEKFPGEFFIPFEQRKTFFLNDEYPEHLRDKATAIIAAEGFFADISPVANGISTVKEMTSLGHKVFICTSDIYGNKTGLADKRTWVQKHLGHDLAKTMIFTRDKTLIHGDYLIDDKPMITGLHEPTWRHIIFDQPFNKNILNKDRIRSDWSDWKDIISVEIK
jgi:5'-nucleotidase